MITCVVTSLRTSLRSLFFVNFGCPGQLIPHDESHRPLPSSDNYRNFFRLVICWHVKKWFFNNVTPIIINHHINFLWIIDIKMIQSLYNVSASKFVIKIWSTWHYLYRKVFLFNYIYVQIQLNWEILSKWDGNGRSNIVVWVLIYTEEWAKIIIMIYIHICMSYRNPNKDDSTWDHMR